MFFFPRAYSISLSEAYQDMLRNNPSQQEAYAAREAANASYNITLGALYPQINASFDTSQTRYDIDDESSLSKQSKQRFGLSLHQALFNRSAWYTFQQGKWLKKAAARTFAYQQQQLTFELIQTYLHTLLALEEQSIIFMQQKQLEAAFKRANVLYSKHSMTKADYYQTKSYFMEAKNNYIQATNRSKIYAENLSMITGVAYHDIKGLGSDFRISMIPSQSLSAWTHKAEKKHAGYQAQNLLLKSSKQSLNAMKAQHWPVVDINASIQKNRYTGDLGFNAFNGIQQSYSISVTLPIYHGGSHEAGRHKAQADYKATQQALKSMHLKLINDIHHAFYNLHDQKSAYLTSIDWIKSTYIAYNEVKQQYRAGTKEIIAYLESLVNYHHALSNQVKQKYKILEYTWKLQLLSGQLDALNLQELSKHLNKTYLLVSSKK
jgi:outer membrane protein TolC